MATAFVVDDELITRMDFAQMLTEMGLEVLGTAVDGFDAVDFCQKQRPDIVLMDIRMPVFDGVTAAEKLLQEDLAGSVLVITAYSDHATMQRTIQAGISGYLVKPVNEHMLFTAVHLALAARKREDALRGKIQELTETIETMKYIDRAKAQMARDQGISETDAYRQMQKLAMDKRCSIQTIATRLLEHSSEHDLANRAKQILMQQNQLSEKAAYKQLAAYAENHHCTVAEAARAIIAARRQS